MAVFTKAKLFKCTWPAKFTPMYIPRINSFLLKTHIQFLSVLFIVLICTFLIIIVGFLGSLVVKLLPANARDEREVGLIPESERSPGEGNGNLLQYSCLENPMDRGAW